MIPHRKSHAKQMLMIAVLLFLSGCVIMYLVNVEIELARELKEFKTKYHNLLKTSTKNGDIHLGDQKICQIPQLLDLNDFFSYGKRNGKGSCTHLAEFGGYHANFEVIFPYNEGSRIICLDGISKGDCTVLSFGVGSDTTFDDDIVLVTNCSIYLFDPYFTLQYKSIARRIQTFSFGLSDERRVVIKGNYSLQYDRLEGILRALNLTNQTIDYLKIDIEGTEVDVFNDIFTTSPQLLDNIRQIGMEMHPFFHKMQQENMTNLDRFRPFWKVMHELECRGFDLISFIPNLFSVCKFSFNGRNVSGCYDLVYVNTKKFGVGT